MEKKSETARRAAVEKAKSNSALSGFAPSEFALITFDQWIAGHWTTSEAVALLVKHHKELEIQASTGDQQASPNKLGITDTVRLQQAEADIVILRMAD
jgi:hypothetical protein